ncbi:hypothetical protein AWY79_07810 [Pseudodesulfovibrio indicus]|uniref:ESPR domain-containing protein n=1 Tax=Pseudodesulfovibrio indicus TaxID=1716143 RepID=A0ABN4LY71_9BACT|nr:hypothetical protein AWY79_07810 [Pseudodesulfovibrio indicus]
MQTYFLKKKSTEYFLLRFQLMGKKYATVLQDRRQSTSMMLSPNSVKKSRLKKAQPSCDHGFWV